ncbi:hypothetical protein CXG81DRAFT_25049 [Caulochytrium protostelioides]|uniref:Calcipressin n=1 Tax=Caulochytrium protostelioides TaxID=1555241 RepID=A0A4P9XAW3_9FUNG|nr:hypothetical protein CXG81DRAFT_25049 [Caulochytrium protostelioides]|eukprot:RKP02270.1 hypothetical protein CXG81DRAFT_25049 [Caulochytrium protostelioides]
MAVRNVPVATNTLILADLPPAAFKDHAAAVFARLTPFGAIARATLLQSMARILIVYRSTPDAVDARAQLDGMPIAVTDDIAAARRVALPETAGPAVAAAAATQAAPDPSLATAVFRIYYGEHTDLDDTTSRLLQLPQLERNFLLSPPGSPVEGWVQGREEGPYVGGHSAIYYESDLDPDDFDLDGGASVSDDARDDGARDDGAAHDSRHMHRGDDDPLSGLRERSPSTSLSSASETEAAPSGDPSGSEPATTDRSAAPRPHRPHRHRPLAAAREAAYSLKPAMSEQNDGRRHILVFHPPAAASSATAATLTPPVVPGWTSPLSAKGTPFPEAPGGFLPAIVIEEHQTTSPAPADADRIAAEVEGTAVHAQRRLPRTALPPR